MKLKYNSLLLAFAFSIALFSCQKFDRPALNLVLDPTPPPYESLKSFWSFENSITDQGENKLTATPSNVSYVAGINGQAVKIGAGGYILFKVVGDKASYPNGFTSISADTLINLGSYTIAFWMNGVGPFTDGAQGLFSISNKNQFWGNLDLFLENYNNAASPNEAYLKIHMFNDNRPGGGEQWNELKIPNVFNKWTHIAVTYNAGNSQLSVYADGQPTSIVNKVLDGGNYGKIKFKDFNGMVLGTHQFQTTPSLTNHGPEAWAKSFNGAFDQFRIYNRALTAAEILDLFTTKK
jgi:hypothetical protein